MIEVLSGGEEDVRIPGWLAMWEIALVSMTQSSPPVYWLGGGTS
jgi:hypothetical protein